MSSSLAHDTAAEVEYKGTSDHYENALESNSASDFKQEGAYPADGQHVHHVQGNVALVTASGEIRLVPTPSDSPMDPLTWGRWKKAVILFCVSWFSVFSLSAIGGFGALAPYFFGLYARQGVNPNDISRLLTWPSLFTGVANFIFLPMSLVIGRRPIYLLASIMFIVSCCTAATSGDNFKSHLNSRIVMGFAAGTTESVLPLILTDITFIHQRATIFGIYWVAQTGIGAVLNLASGYEAASLDWPWYYWIFVILVTFGALVSFFGLPETRFERPVTSIDGQITKVDQYGQIIVLSDEEAEIELARQRSTLENLVHSENNATPSYLRSLNPFSPIAKDPFTFLAHCYKDMALSLLDPAIIWALGASSLILGVSIATSLSFGQTLIIQGWKESSTGLFYLGQLVAAGFAFLFAGWGGDKINVYMAKRNNGVHLPEHRLVALVFPGLLGIGTGMMFAVVSQHPERYHWFALVFAGTAFAIAFISTLIVTTTYAVEALPKLAGPALVVVVGGKNLIAFGLSDAVVPLANAGRFMYLYGITVGVTAGWLALGVPLYFLMPKYREWKSRR